MNFRTLAQAVGTFAIDIMESLAVCVLAAVRVRCAAAATMQCYVLQCSMCYVLQRRAQEKESEEFLQRTNESNASARAPVVRKQSQAKTTRAKFYFQTRKRKREKYTKRAKNANLLKPRQHTRRANCTPCARFNWTLFCYLLCLVLYDARRCCKKQRKRKKQKLVVHTK